MSVPHTYHFATAVRVVSMRSTELPPTMILNVPGSTTLCMSRSRNESSIEAESELYCPGFAGLERDPPEAAQFFNRPRNRTHLVADIELDDFVAANFAGVVHVHADFGLAWGPIVAGAR